jgi:rhodanese-related sulfurtransferase
MMALACLLVHACAQDDSPSANTYSDPAVNEMKKQIIDEKKTDDKVYKGQPWATSTLNESNKKKAAATAIMPVQISSSAPTLSTNNLAAADLFLKEVLNNGSFTLSVPNFLGISNMESDWSIVDVSPAELYAQGHIPNAMSIPLADLIAGMGTIPAGKKVAVYSNSDINSAFAVETLRVFANRDAWMLQGGVPAWEAAGQTIDK